MQLREQCQQQNLGNILPISGYWLNYGTLNQSCRSQSFKLQRSSCSQRDTLHIRQFLSTQSFMFLLFLQAVKIKVAQSCPTLYHATDCSPPASSVRGILQARIVEWVAISLPRGSSQPRDQTRVSISCIGGWVLYHQHHLGSPASGEQHFTMMWTHRIACLMGSLLQVLVHG